MSISLTVDEIMSIKDEIKRNKEKNKQLNDRLTILEEEIRDYMVQKDQTGLRYKNKIIMLETFQSSVLKTKKDKKAIMIDYLKSVGIPNPEQEYDKIQKLQRKEPTEKSKIRIK